MRSMTEVCFFNQHASDVLQHIAVFFEAGAIFLVWRDYKIRESDLSSTGRRAMVTGLSGPRMKRTKELIYAFVIGAIAICMESYQLTSQYLGC